MKCKITGEKINPFMSFGKMPIANGFIKKKDFKSEYFYNLEVGFTEKLSLFQINEHPRPEQMFNKNYPFFTGSSKEMVKHFKNYADWIIKSYGKNLKYLIEIGSNDGTFLSNFKKKNIKVIGFEPSKNVAEISKKRGIKTINSFFTYENVKKFKKLKNTISVISAANVICHIPDLNNLIKGVKYLLKNKGIFVFEEPYLGSMYQKVSYDQIYDEHIYVFSVSSILKIFKLHKLELIDAIPQKTHGGSMRYIIANKGAYKIKKNVSRILLKEKRKNIDKIEGCLKFKKACEKSKLNLITKIKSIKKKNKSIGGYAATSKSTTILNYCDINNKHIDFICDTTPEKIGKFSPGTHIPIVSMDYFYKKKPDFVFLFAWNHKQEIFKKEKNFVKKDKWFAHIKL